VNGSIPTTTSATSTLPTTNATLLLQVVGFTVGNRCACISQYRVLYLPVCPTQSVNAVFTNNHSTAQAIKNTSCYTSQHCYAIYTNRSSNDVRYIV
jgi:hypothetical protein